MTRLKDSSRGKRCQTAGIGPLLIRKGTLQDVAGLARRLREQDRKEMLLAAGASEEETLALSVKWSSEVWAAEENGLVIALGGFGLMGTIGIPWLVGSDELLKYPVKLVKEGRKAVARWEPLCAVMANFVHQDNTVHIEWLKRIGFTMGPAREINGAPFIEFFRYSKQCAH